MIKNKSLILKVEGGEIEYKQSLKQLQENTTSYDIRETRSRQRREMSKTDMYSKM